MWTDMEMTIDEILKRPYWIIDILPKQVPKDSPGQYFSVEKYFLEEERLAMVKQKHANLILKLNCYRQISIFGEYETNPAPERIAEEIRKRSIFILVDGAMISSEPDETYLTVYGPDDELLELIKAIAAGEGLFVWK